MWHFPQQRRGPERAKSLRPITQHRLWQQRSTIRHATVRRRDGSTRFGTTFAATRRLHAFNCRYFGKRPSVKNEAFKTYKTCNRNQGHYNYWRSSVSYNFPTPREESIPLCSARRQHTDNQSKYTFFAESSLSPIMEQIVIREANKADLPAVDALLDASYTALLPESYDDVHLRSLLPFIRQANPMLLESGTYYVAETSAGYSKEIVGAGGWVRSPGSDVARVECLVVHPQCVKHNIGRSIVAKCEVEARAAGIRLLDAYSAPAAEGFFSKMGFSKLRDVDISMGDGRTVMPTVLLEIPL
jgi:N-acetylglutamate synthase-like GNAT family acetyltransferase